MNIQPFIIQKLNNESLNEVSVDSYFERLPEKEDIVPPIKTANPEKRIIIPSITITSASPRGIFLFSSHETGCSQMMLMKSASKKE